MNKIEKKVRKVIKRVKLSVDEIIERESKLIPIIMAAVIIASGVLTVGGTIYQSKKDEAEPTTSSYDGEYDYNGNPIYGSSGDLNKNPLSDEEVAYYEEQAITSYFSPETIKELKATIINEYGVVIDLITNNELAKKTDPSVENKLDSNRIETVINKYAEFKINCNKDKEDYSTASEETRISEAYKLYDEQIKVLELKIKEARQAAKYIKATSSDEFHKAYDDIEAMEADIRLIEAGCDVMGKRQLDTQLKALIESEQEQNNVY